MIENILQSVPFRPSFYAHALNGFLLLVAIIVFFMNYNKILRLEPHKLIQVILMFSLVIGVHSISHLGLEAVYNYNPLYFYK